MNNEQYNHKKIEKKWQKQWEEQGLYKAKDFSKKQKQYILFEFPYPSGQGLHTGHCRPYIALDAVVRKKRMEGKNVLFPIGWDAFGLPAENFAIKNKTHPRKTTEQNIAHFKKQFKSLGISLDWDREINTTDPKYYRWTQWIFLKLFEKGLAYQTKMPINWCPKCKIGLANEEVVAGKCERCNAVVEKKKLKQWMLKITEYADRLIDDLDKVDYPERVKSQQINWIGRSQGAEIEFPVFSRNSSHCHSERSEESPDLFVDTATSRLREGSFGRPVGLPQDDNEGGGIIKVFTTRIDTIFGSTYLVVAPEHEIIQNSKFKIQNLEEIKEYVRNSVKKSDLERAEIDKEKTGIELKGIKAINPFNKQEIPIFVADYVLPNYGTGAIMAVPAHDERDFAFAKKYKLPILPVIARSPDSCHCEERSDEAISSLSQEIAASGSTPPRNDGAGDIPFTEDGILINSEEFDGLSSQQARKKMTDFAKKQKFGKQTINYKLRDWVFSRQHYWGEPIPLIHCEKCGVVAVPEKDLPVKLPYVEKYEPTGTGESPLAGVDDWVNCKCPECKGKAKRETDTMPNWAGSSWYYLRYIDPHNDKVLADSKKLKYWLPVDWYNGGMEHTTLHLLYSRFWHKFLYDIKVVPDNEPYQKRTSHGIVLAEDGRKMSKSFGNVVNPDDIIEKFGADSLRIYEMFMGPFEQAIEWNSQGVVGARRFLEKVWKLSFVIASEPSPLLRHSEHFAVAQHRLREESRYTKRFFGRSAELSQNDGDGALEKLIHQTIKKVSEDIENLKFNTAISSLMVLTNAMEKQEQLSTINYQLLLKLLSPFAPHITEELWLKLQAAFAKATAPKVKKSIFMEKWPEYDKNLIKEDQITLVIQINGKVRDSVECQANISEAEAKEFAMKREKVKKYTDDKTIKKIIFVKGKLINIVC